jgi:uncharacterized protein
LAPHLVGIISDTHGLLRPAATAALAGCELIVHAGDVGGAGILAELRRIAPVVAVRGNVDGGPWADRLHAWETREVAGIRIHVRHIREQLDVEGVDVVITGHTHRPVVEKVGGVLFVNPGSAGPRRFRLPVSVARLEIAAGNVEARIVELAVE